MKGSNFSLTSDTKYKLCKFYISWTISSKNFILCLALRMVTTSILLYSLTSFKCVFDSLYTFLKYFFRLGTGL
nr:MAG TPA: hypothetical protein [Caudoviricetes sp.]